MPPPTSGPPRPHPSTYPSRSSACLLPIQVGALHCMLPSATHPCPPRLAPSQCRLPASCAPGILLELEVVVDDQFSESSEGEIGRCCVRSAVGERRLKRFHASRSRWGDAAIGFWLSGRVRLPHAQVFD